jgi:hypothetical protein
MPFPFGKEPRSQISGGWSLKVSREVSVYSTDDRGFALGAAHSRPWEWRSSSKSAFDQIPRSQRTALQQPPRPAAIARGKLSSRLCPSSNLPARSDRPSALLPGGFCADLSCSRPARRECLTERNFDTEPQYPYCYGSRPNNRLESTANAHTAADLHVRPVSKTALVSRSWTLRAVKNLHNG